MRLLLALIAASALTACSGGGQTSDPVGQNLAFSTAEDSPRSADLSDFQTSDNIVSYRLVSGPSNGRITVADNGVFTYTPAQDYNGEDSFVYEVTSRDGQTSTGNVVITITPDADSPVANPSSASGNEDSTITGQANATDVDSESLSYFLETPASNGTVTLSSGGRYTYVPEPNFSGEDSFTFTASDESTTSNSAVVSITVIAVNDAPVAESQSRSVNEDQALNSQLTATDAEGDALSYSVATPARNGAVTITSGGSYTYVPAPDFNGSDSFTFTASDASATSNTAVVSITVNNVNDAPVAAGQNRTTNEDQALNSQLTATDVDGDALSYAIETQASNGTVTLRSNGGYTYTPDLNFNGGDSFTFTASDASATSNTAIVSITVSSVNDAPVAQDQSRTVNEDETLNSQLNATDIDGSDTLTYSLDTQGSNGTAIIQPNGSYSYQPDAAFSGTDTLTFSVSDGNGGTDTGTVSITIVSVNDAPVANNKAITIDEDSDTVTDSVSATDEDDDDGSLVYELDSPASNGTATVDPDGTIQYTPVANFNGEDTFTFVVSDDADASGTGTVTITVTSINDLPVAEAQSLVTDEDTTVGGQASATDVDHADSELRYRLSQAASNGAASISDTGVLSYTPNSNFNGSDTFVYEVFDPENGTDTAEVSITVNPVDDPANIANDNLEVLVAEDTLFSDQLTVTDPDGDTITYELSTDEGETAQFGAASVTAETGEYSYQPGPDYNGDDGDDRDYADDRFRVVVFENGLEIGRITINIEVTPVNDPPQAIDGFYGTAVDTTLNGNLPATDVDGDQLTFNLADDNTTMGAILTVNEDGSFSYTPPPGEAVEDSFTFTVFDGEETSPPATAEILVVETAQGTSRQEVLTSLAGPSSRTGTPPPPGPPVMIHFAVHEPTAFNPELKYPLILEGHGYGGAQTNGRNNGGFKGLLNAGYGVISITQRGFGRTQGNTDTGTIRLFDPDYEGRDLMQIIDWAQENLPWLLYKDNDGNIVDKDHPEANIVLGAIGGSYGGGFQHTIAAIDSKRRIDAIAAEITWHDLRYSLFSGNVFKTYWAGLLSAVGNATGTQDPEVNEGLSQGVALNMLDQEKLDLLYRVSFISHCEDSNTYTHNVTADGGRGPDVDNLLEPVDALYWQSPNDTLFNMNEMQLNAACLRARGADVRALTKPNGHDTNPGENCGPRDVNSTVRVWFDEKLKGIPPSQADRIPDNCFNLRQSPDATANDHIVTTVFPVGGDEFEIDDNGQDAGGDAIAITANGNNTGGVVRVPLFTATEDTIIAGVPIAELTLGGPFAPPEGLPDQGLLPSDPILFIGIMIDGTLHMPNQVRPIRQYKTHNIDLIGLNEIVRAGQTVELAIYPGFPGRYPDSGTKQPTPVTLQGTVELPLHSISELLQ